MYTTLLTCLIAFYQVNKFLYFFDLLYTIHVFTSGFLG